MSTYIIAEIGNTHEGSVGLAKQFIKAAADTGVDCVKFQTHIFEAESLDDAPNPPYFKDETRKEYFERTSFTSNEHKKLKEYTNSLGCDFISSPFSIEALELLEDINVPFYKVASGEVSNIPLLEALGRTKKKVLLSSGMSNWEQVGLAIKTLQDYGCPEIILLQCTSKYPCPPEYSGLNMMRTMSDKFNLSIGFSDHTSGNAISIAAVVLGAKIIEKHFTLDKNMVGWDHKVSADESDLSIICEEGNKVYRSLGSTYKVLAPEEIEKREKFRRSATTAKDLEKGHVLTKNDFVYKRPGTGIKPNEIKYIIGRKLNTDIKKDITLSLGDFE